MKSEMATTPNYQLNLPSLDDEADITKLNENFEKIDKVLKQNESDTTVTEKIEQINTKIGEPTDDHTKQTVFGKIAGVLKRVVGIDDKVGTPSDSATQQTVFGKIKKVQEKVDNIDTNAARLTAQRALYIDKIQTLDTKIGTSDQSAGTNSIFAWLQKIYDKLNTSTSGIKRTASLTGTGATVYSSSNTIRLDSGDAVIAKFVAPVSGQYSLSANLLKCITYKDSYCQIGVLRQTRQYFRNKPDLIDISFDFRRTYNISNVGGSVLYCTKIANGTQNTQSSQLPGIGLASDLLSSLMDSFNVVKEGTLTGSLFFEAGEKVMIYISINNSMNLNTVEISNVKVEYQPLT